MKNRLLLACTALALALALSLSLSPALRAQDGAPMKHDDKHTELGDQMDGLNKAYKALKKQVADATKNADSLALVAKIKASATAALKLKPEYTADKPAAEQAQFVEKFQAEMKKMIELVGKLETALKADKNDDAAKLIADLDAEQKAAHKEFRKPKPKM
jgi:cytochrome c556